ncbi:MAG: dihydropteroate synthase [Burkholderiaceae bacterium]
MTERFSCGRFDLSISAATRPLVMGILNVTPDSFSDGGRFLGLNAALSHADQMLCAGVDIIDIGGESSRPGAPPLSPAEELARVMPVLRALRDCGKPLSVDTCKPQVMREVLGAGADMINDIRGFQEEDALSAVMSSNCGICVMHMQRTPETMQAAPVYGDVVGEVTQFLQERVAIMLNAGVSRSRICIDPGIGFGKTQTHNVSLMQHIRSIGNACDMPVLIGASRKAMIGRLTGKPPDQRTPGSIAAALAAVAQGARIVRVHDVAETIDALCVWRALYPHVSAEAESEPGRAH